MSRSGLAPADSAVKELYARAACQGKRCALTKVNWVPTVRAHPRTGARVGSGRPIPLDVGRDPLGPIVLDQAEPGVWQARPFELGFDDPGRARYTVHWLTCLTPSLYREVRSYADPHALFPAVPLRHKSVSYAVCARCGGDRSYDAFAALCLTCARIVVKRWSPAMQATIAKFPADLRRLLDIDDLPSGG